MNTSSYTGNYDSFHARIGQGIQEFHTPEGDETYCGPFVRDAYHGYGQYTAKNAFGESWAYEGMFYVNKFHGYGTISYADGTVFSGLFKMGKQFGPGVMTYPDGKQDVGVWIGSHILRLSVSVSGVEHLCSTSRDRIQASVLKKLVPIPVEDPEKDEAENVLNFLDLNPNIYAEKLYSRHNKDPRSLLFNKKLYKEYSNRRLTDLKNLNVLFPFNKETFFNDPTTYARVNAIKLSPPKEQSKEEGESSLEALSLAEDNLSDFGSSTDFTRNALLLSWNNQEIIIELMLHSFNFRRQECITDYDVGDILCNRRLNFAESGVKEEGSIQMLLASSKNDPKTILKLLKTLHLNPDVMDNVGNSMIIQAAAHDCDAVIEILAQIGANLNSVNDEGFNALTYTLTRYLALMHNVTDWAKGFMPPYDIKEEDSVGKEWMAHCSKLLETRTTLKQSRFSRQISRLKSRTTSTILSQEGEKTKYIFDLSPMPSHNKVISDLSAESLSTLYPKDGVSGIEYMDFADKKTRMKKIEKTFSLLLEVGVDVNGSVTPAPLITLSIFTQNVNIVESILKYGVNPNSQLDIDPGHLTPLHVIVLVKPLRPNIRIVELLLEYGANPSLRTEKGYRQEYWKYLLTYGRPGTCHEGMTPLHALLLRPDADYVPKKKYLMDLCCILAWHSGSDFFFGLNALGLAIAQGNLQFAKVLISCSKIKINEKFDYFWGNPLTTYLIIHGTNKSNSSYKMLDLLLNSGADPLTRLSDEENIINFVDELGKKLRRHGKRPSKHRNSITSDIFSPSSVQSLSYTDLMAKTKELAKKEIQLKVIAKQRVESYIKGVLIRSLLYCMQKTVEDDNQVAELFPKIIKYLWDWVDQKEIPNLFAMNLKEAEFSDGIALINALLIFINFPELFQKGQANPEDVSSFLKSMNKSKPIDKSILFTAEKSYEIEKNLRSFNAQQLKPAEVDKDGDLYKVCYQCLKRSSYCLLCTMCELVYLCSLECNVKDAEDLQSKHKCRLVFWGLPPVEHFVLCKPEDLLKFQEKKESKINLRNKSSELSISSVARTAYKTPPSKGAHLLMKEAVGAFKNLFVKGLRPLKKKEQSDKKLIRKGDKEGINFPLKKTIMKRRNRGIDLKHVGISQLKPSLRARLDKLTKMRRHVSWKEKLFDIINDLDLGSQQSGMDAKKKMSGYSFPWPKKNTICPKIFYDVLGGKILSKSLWQTYETTYNFTLSERLLAFSSGFDVNLVKRRIRSLLMSMNLSFGLDVQHLLPYCVYVPFHGHVLYKSYVDVLLENYSFN